MNFFELRSLKMRENCLAKITELKALLGRSLIDLLKVEEPLDKPCEWIFQPRHWQKKAKYQNCVIKNRKSATFLSYAAQGLILKNIHENW